MFNPAKLKNIFKSSDSEEYKNTSEPGIHIRWEPVMFDGACFAHYCSIGAKTCYNLEASDSYKKNLDHIKRIMGYGHDSISSHSNIMFLMTIDSYKNNSDVSSLLYALPSLRFMNISILPDTRNLDDNIWTTRILISGSIRAYRYFIKTFYDDYIPNNGWNTDFFEIIKDVIYNTMEKEFFIDYINMGILEEDKFQYIAPLKIDVSLDQNGDEIADVDEDSSPMINKVYSSEHVDILYRDDIYQLYKELLTDDIINTHKEDKLLDDILNCGIIILRLKNYSRATSQQINRHLSGISQESQRYVNYSTCKFINPFDFHNNKEECNAKKYKIKLFNTEVELTPQELGDSLMSIYSQLKDQGMQNQDARSFLPINAETKAIHTFTYKNMIHFIKLRNSQFAQQEVRQIAKEIKDLMMNPIEEEEEDNSEMLDIIKKINLKLLDRMDNK